jgi:Family of unknown function (DUF5395)
VTEPEIVLRCSNGRWQALGLGLALEHAELRGLETVLERELALRGVSSVAIRFDMSSLPAALRQYHAHYFNYSLRIAQRRVPA